MNTLFHIKPGILSGTSVIFHTINLFCYDLLHVYFIAYPIHLSEFTLFVLVSETCICVLIFYGDVLCVKQSYQLCKNKCKLFTV